MSSDFFPKPDMSEPYQQFYKAYCRGNLSVSGSPGFQIRAISDGLVLAEASAMAPSAKYWCPSEPNPGQPPGRRLALFRRAGDAFLAHGVRVMDNRTDRDENSFEHVIARLPKGFSALEALKMWRSPAWRIANGDFSPKLPPFVWSEAEWGPDFQVSDRLDQSELAKFRDETIAHCFLQQDSAGAAYILQACLAAAQGQVEQFFLVGGDDTIVRSLFVAFCCFPERLRQTITFSTHENPSSPKEVQIVGVTTFDGHDRNLLSIFYAKPYCALNTVDGTRTDSLAVSHFAESAIQWLYSGEAEKYGWLAEVRNAFDALDPADNPSLVDLDLLAEHAARGDAAQTGTDMVLKVWGSPAIAHSKLRNGSEFGALLCQAQNDPEFSAALVAQLGTWLPRHSAAAVEFPGEVAEVALSKVKTESPFEELAWLGEFAGRLGPEFAVSYWEELLVKCRARGGGSVSGEDGMPAVATRLKLLEVWQRQHELAEAGGRSDFAELATCWLRVPPQELGSVLSSGLKEELKRLAVRLWLESGSHEDFRRIIGEARKSDAFKGQVLVQWQGLAREPNNVLRRLPLELAKVGFQELRDGGPFKEVAWLGSLAAPVGAALEVQFWEELLWACQNSLSGIDPAKNLFPELPTRLSLLEAWEKALKGRREALASVAGAWLRVAPEDVKKVLKSGLSAELKAEALRLWLSASAPMETELGKAIFDLVCLDVKLTWGVFFSIPQWQAWTALKNIPVACLSRFLECQAQQMRLENFLDTQFLEPVKAWHHHVPQAVTGRMDTLWMFGQYVQQPGAFQQVTDLGELSQPAFWKKERGRDPAVNKAVDGAVDALLYRGDLEDFERALDWFGEKWTASAVELVQLVHSRLQAVPDRCQNASLRRLLVVLGTVLKEWKAHQSNVSTMGPRTGSVDLDLRKEEYQVLARVAERHFPGSSLLRSPTGHAIIGLLHANCQCIETASQKWVNKLHTLLELLRSLKEKCNAADFQTARIVALSQSYITIGQEADGDMRAEVNTLLLKEISKNPKEALTVALVAFVNNVYEENIDLYLRGFMPGFLLELIRLEHQNENGAVAEVFVKFCLEGCVLVRSPGDFGDHRSRELGIWLDQFRKAMTSKSIKKVHHLALKWGNADTRERWYALTQYKDRWGWTRTPTGKRFLIALLTPAILGVVVIVLMWSWLVFQERQFRNQEPASGGKILSAWLDQYQTASGATNRARLDAEKAIREIGTNGIPILLRMVSKKDTTASKLFHRLPQSQWHQRVVTGFAVLHAAGTPALQPLESLLTRKNIDVQICAARCLAEIGSESDGRLRTQLTNAEPRLRAEVTNALRRIEQRAGSEGRSQ